MDGFNRRKEHSKEDIRRAAEDLFTRFGIGKVSINDIARKAGVSQATIYNNFGSKENLVRDYHGSIMKNITGSFRNIIVMKKSWVDKLQGLLQSWIDIADRYKLETENSRQSVEYTQGDMVEKEIENSFKEFIKDGKEQGNLPANISDEAIMAYIRFFRQGISSNHDINDRMHRDIKFSDDLLSLFIYGVVGDRQRSSITSP
jgi:AcrR family transcriptional regulator